MPQYKKVFDVGTYAGGSGYTRVGIPTLRTPGAGGKQVPRSLRFRAANSAYLSRTQGAATNGFIWTWSAWVKRGSLGANQVLFCAGAPSNTQGVQFIATDVIQIFRYTGTYTVQLDTTQVFRDPSAWYHLVIANDVTQATASNRVKFYVNGTQVTSFTTATYPAQNTQYEINNNGQAATIGRYSAAAASQFDGYQAEIYFIDGQALTPSSFGEYNSDNIWVPKAYSGSYGTNGFYLDFSDVALTSGSNAGYGKDTSGNGNYWNTNGLSVTAGTTYDSMYDSPTDYDNSVYGAGNYCTLNPLVNGSVTISNGNLTALGSTGGYPECNATFNPEGLKGYFEITIGTTDSQFGFIPTSISPATTNYTNTSMFCYFPFNGAIRQGNTNLLTSYTTSGAIGDVIGFAFDFTNGARNVWFSRNGTWGTNGSVGNPASGTFPGLTISQLTNALGPWRFYLSTTSSGTNHFNFGQRQFAYTPPSGFLALNTKNITRPTDANMWFYGDTPDLMWIKNRSATADHSLTDTVRGVGLGLSSSSTAVEQGAQDVAEMNKFGMTLIGASSRTTAASNSFVYWAWKGGGAASSNTNGTITSQVSANTAAGFSVVTWTGTGATGATVGHGLNILPSMVIIKKRNVVENWYVAHSGSGQGINYAYHLFLNTAGALSGGNDPYLMGSQISSTSNVLALADGISNNGGNQSGTTYVAYCFAPVAGYSAFGSYTGNGSADGTFVYTGFRPRWVIIKSTTLVQPWNIFDTSRDAYNVEGQYLQPSNSGAEATFATLDVTSNGFKLRTTGAHANSSGDVLIYAAFAEHPFKIARAR